MKEITIKVSREVKVGLLAALCLFLLYFGFRFLKGENIFNPTHSYSGRFVELRGLTEQAPVYVRGFKVGLVEEIKYDFTQDTAFTVLVSLNDDILVTEGSHMRIIADGLLGGSAIEVIIPAGSDLAEIPVRSELPAGIQPTLMDELKGTMLTQIDSALFAIRQLVDNVNGQLEGDRLKSILANADVMVASLKVSSLKLEGMMKNDVPAVMQQVESILVDVKKLSANVSEADIAALVARADSAIANVNAVIEAANSTDGTVGKLLHDNSLYKNVNSTVQTADSLMQDIREQPNSLIWGKKKKRK